MTAQTVPLVVIGPGIVGLPEIEQRARNRLALRGIDVPADDQPRSRHPRFQQRLPLRRVGRVERPGGLRQGGSEIIVVAALRGRRQERRTRRLGRLGQRNPGGAAA
jgi:hypothetical protein